MRKIRVLIVPLALLALLLAACSSEPPTLTTPLATSTQAPTAAPPPTPIPSPTATPEPTATPVSTPTPEPVKRSFEDVRGIVDPANFGWPREVEGLNGVVTIPSKPRRIITASVGHDEMTLALVPRDRLVESGALRRTRPTPTSPRSSKTYRDLT